MRTAFLFPGQGSQYAGMGKDLYHSFPEVRELYDRASAILGFDLADLSFNGPSDLLTRTDNAQPAIYTHSMALSHLLKRAGAEADIVAGHSLGEYSALAYSEALSFEEGLRLVRRRGELMLDAGGYAPGGMAAVIGLDAEAVTELCRLCTEQGEVYPANFNAPGQIVISGRQQGIERAAELAAGMGARRVIPLEVSGAFHTPFMVPAAAELEKLLTPLDNAAIPVVTNAEAIARIDKTDLKAALVKQIAGPVRWEESMRYLLQQGVTVFVEVGPGKVLTGLMKRTEKGVNTAFTDDATGLASVLDFLKAGG
ncbi:MAG: ACP S-malonyltransferase [bacterium]|jgi:[acyl-carrier-protein] S-malonyltransferase|nr:ACP S-malonyltransferase [bacterium]